MTGNGHHERMAEAARKAADRVREERDNPEPSMGERLGQIGVLGWTVITPILLGLFLGRWLDRRLDTGIFFSAPLLMLGAALGFWFLWKWIHRKL